MYIKKLSTCVHCGLSMATSRTKIHERLCLEQQRIVELPKRKSGRQIGTVAWNKGLTKTDLRVLKNSLSVSKALKGKPGHPLTEKQKTEISKRQSLHNNGGKSKWYEVGGKHRYV